MKNKFTFLIFALLIFFILSNFVSADVGPKPSVTIDILYNGNKIPDAIFSAKMLSCNYQMKYEEIISALEPYEKSGEWYDECKKIASDYGFEERICYGELQYQRGMTNLSSRDFCKIERIEKILRIVKKLF